MIVQPSLSELQQRFGPIDPNRFRLDRYPATEKDLLVLLERKIAFCELVDGVLIEKICSFPKSVISGEIITALHGFARSRKLGVVTGIGGPMRIAPNVIRCPDVGFTNWEQFPERCIPKIPVPSIHPDLAVEVLSEGNTKREMQEKILNYFDAGTTLVWLVDPGTRSVTVFTSPEESATVPVTGTLDGGTVLPGFTLAVADIFAELAPAA